MGREKGGSLSPRFPLCHHTPCASRERQRETTGNESEYSIHFHHQRETSGYEPRTSQVGFNVDNCGGPQRACDTGASWKQANRIIIEEVNPPVVQPRRLFVFITTLCSPPQGIQSHFPIWRRRQIDPSTGPDSQNPSAWLKERSKANKDSKLKRVLLKTNEDVAPQSQRIFRGFQTDVFSVSPQHNLGQVLSRPQPHSSFSTSLQTRQTVLQSNFVPVNRVAVTNTRHASLCIEKLDYLQVFIFIFLALFVSSKNK